MELQIKSTEYKVQDDSQVRQAINICVLESCFDQLVPQVQDESENASPGGDQEEVDEVEGFNFGRLK